MNVRIPIAAVLFALSLAAPCSANDPYSPSSRPAPPNPNSVDFSQLPKNRTPPKSEFPRGIELGNDTRVTIGTSTSPGTNREPPKTTPTIEVQKDF